MAPRHRQAQTGQLRSHSRSSSATRIGLSLQITHKEHHPKHPDKFKKNDLHNKPTPPIPKVNSNQHVPSKQNGATKPKAGFTLSHQGDEDDDEWISTESGAASPDRSDNESDMRTIQERLRRVQIPDERQSIPPHDDRPETPRPPQDHPTPSPPASLSLPRQIHRPSSNKRRSRPPSTHSLGSRTEPALRPHHLCHIPKQGPLAPLTVIPDSAPGDPTSPGQSYHDTDDPSTSPSSVTTSNAALKRRASISSARSVATVPFFHTKDAPRPVHERTRTLSSIHTSSSSAALSSLAYLPTVTRPPSPQAVVFFPPPNPHANTDNIHPLLPSPYMSYHMTVLARRTPLRESFDRVMRAKLAASR